MRVGEAVYLVSLIIVAVGPPDCSAKHFPTASVRIRHPRPNNEVNMLWKPIAEAKPGEQVFLFFPTKGEDGYAEGPYSRIKKPG